MDCLSDIQGAGIIYNEKDAYGVRSSLDNVLRLLSALFGKEIMSFEELAPCFSNERLGRTVYIEKVDAGEYRLRLHDSRYDGEGSAREMDFFVHDWHSWVKFYTIKAESREDLAELLGADYEHLQMKLLVDSPLPGADDVATLEYIMYSKNIEEDILDSYVLMMIEIIKKERSLKKNAQRLLRWLFQRQYSEREEETFKEDVKKIFDALEDLDEPEFLEKFSCLFLCASI